jgi:hypothetical protein
MAFSHSDGVFSLLWALGFGTLSFLPVHNAPAFCLYLSLYTFSSCSFTLTLGPVPYLFYRPVLGEERGIAHTTFFFSFSLQHILGDGVTRGGIGLFERPIMLD